jgi:hypothetical protein
VVDAGEVLDDVVPVVVDCPADAGAAPANPNVRISANAALILFTMVTPLPSGMRPAFPGHEEHQQAVVFEQDKSRAR